MYVQKHSNVGSGERGKGNGKKNGAAPNHKGETKNNRRLCGGMQRARKSKKVNQT